MTLLQLQLFHVEKKKVKKRGDERKINTEKILKRGGKLKKAWEEACQSGGWNYGSAVYEPCSSATKTIDVLRRRRKGTCARHERWSVNKVRCRCLYCLTDEKNVCFCTDQ